MKQNEKNTTVRGVHLLTSHVETGCHGQRRANPRPTPGKKRESIALLLKTPLSPARPDGATHTQQQPPPKQNPHNTTHTLVVGVCVRVCALWGVEWRTGVCSTGEDEGEKIKQKKKKKGSKRTPPGKGRWVPCESEKKNDDRQVKNVECYAKTKR